MNQSFATESLYERIGGEATVDAALEIFYKKVLDDQSLMAFFRNTDMDRLLEKQKAFLTLAFGGPSNYTYWQRGLRNAHRTAVEEGMNDQHFDKVMLYLEDTLKQLSISAEIISEVIAVVEATRKHVLNR
jgi:hemoglobin